MGDEVHIRKRAMQPADTIRDLRPAASDLSLMQRTEFINSHKKNPELQNIMKRAFIREVALHIPDENLDVIYLTCSSCLLQTMEKILK